MCSNILDLWVLTTPKPIGGSNPMNLLKSTVWNELGITMKLYICIGAAFMAVILLENIVVAMLLS